MFNWKKILVLGAVRRQDLLALPKGGKIADFLHID